MVVVAEESSFSALDLSRPAGTLGLARALIALQDADCTTVRREFDLGEAAAHRAEQAFGEFRRDVPHAVRVRLQIRFRLVVDSAGSSLRLEVKGIAPGEMHLDGALAAFHRIDSGANEVAVKKNIARHGEE